MEAVGHKEAFDFVQDLVKNQVPLSESIIKQIHYLVLADKKDDRGVYRRVPVRIMGAKHESVQPYLIQPKMEQLLVSYRNNTEHIIPRLARFHIEFARAILYGRFSDLHAKCLEIKKNVPRHILAPSAVACDNHHLRASAHLRHAVPFCLTGSSIGISC